MTHELAYWLGLTDPSGAPYLFWSGFFADVALLGAPVVFWWRHTCHEPKCWRAGRIQTDGRAHCRRHHPRG